MERGADAHKKLVSGFLVPRTRKSRRLSTSKHAQYRNLRRCGSVSHGGFSLGVERLVGYLAGLLSIKGKDRLPRLAGGQAPPATSITGRAMPEQ